MLPWFSRDAIPLGTYGPPLLRQTLAVPKELMRTHIHVGGLSGSGESRFMAGLTLMLERAGFSWTLVDPHGDLAKLVLASGDEWLL